MGPGSFWTQPAGQTHITAAGEGGKATAFLEIMEGPYLVRPPDASFDDGDGAAGWRHTRISADSEAFSKETAFEVEH